ncbi:MAG TPA: zf-HC2 domain-containing protein [Gemmatimonadaceae bacterium]
MQHPDEGTIHSWLDGALSADEAARIEAHVQECSQCAVAVAEARGFIAASSRILTALDNAPRGVIPVTAPKKRIDPMVWRVAATVLVVAAGTFVVVRDRGSDEQPTSVTAGRGILLEKRASLPEQAPSAIGQAPSVGDAAAPKAAASKALAIGTARKTVVSDSSSDVASRDSKAIASAGVMMRAGQRAAGPGYAGGPAPTAPTLVAPLGVTGALTMDAARASEPLKVIGTPQRIGVKVTLYEVVPGDTVTLTEQVPPSLTSTVVAGTAAAPIERQASGKSAGASSKAGANPPAMAAARNQKRVDEALSASAPSAALPTAQNSLGNTVNTISWNDSAGNTLTLTGRMSKARLQEIKIRIERERAAAAAKKNP